MPHSTDLGAKRQCQNGHTLNLNTRNAPLKPRNPNSQTQELVAFQSLAFLPLAFRPDTHWTSLSESQSTCYLWFSDYRLTLTHQGDTACGL